MVSRNKINIGSFFDFDYLKLSVASPERILSWSYGEVKNSDTLNYRTLKPEKDGLFCSKIFGPVKDYECSCGKYRHIKYKGIRCEKCETDVTRSSVRRERMGHINLVYPVANTLYFKLVPSIISVLLDISTKALTEVIYFEKYIVIDPGETNLKKKQILTKNEYQKILVEFSDKKKIIGTGAKSIRSLLETMNLEEECEQQKAKIKLTSSDLKSVALNKRLKIIEYFISSGVKPEWMILTVLPVLPPELRPIVPVGGGKMAVSDLNNLYANVINRNNRLKKLLEMDAPDIIIHNECKLLQDAVNALLNNSSSSQNNKVAKNSFGVPFKSIADLLKGKTGYFRQNLLGKRVDYSGRSVIVSGPELKLHQCGLPKLMALELFKPFIISKLRLYGKIKTIKEGLIKIDKKLPEVFEVLEEIVKEHPVLLNRAPTLHRLGIQAFEPKLVEIKAIQLHPLVCRAFNADFDGDQMAVHIPLSIEAQIEARVLMLASNNILSPSSGKPMIVPRKDITVGIYYMTNIFKGEKGEGHVFYSYEDALNALLNGFITINTKIGYYYRYEDSETDKDKLYYLKETNVGRLMLLQYIPHDGKISFEYLNRAWSIGFLEEVVKKVYEVYGGKQTVIFCDKIMMEGFKHATLAAVSFGKNDIIIPETKYSIINGVKENIKKVDEQFNDGYITEKERYNKVTDLWSECTDVISNDVMDLLNINADNAKVNSITLMMNSGARASKAQMKQLAGMKGLIVKPDGSIIETPVLSNFKEGLSVAEYFNAAHGARKGNVDTALKTADAGYLTRRLVDVAQDCIVTEEDCGCSHGILYKVQFEDNGSAQKLSSIIKGRFLSKDILDTDGKVLLKKGDFIDSKAVEVLDKYNITEAEVRSPVTCECKYGICAKCYGVDLSTSNLVNIGEAVGVIAAQTIGEPGTQLTLNTFHIGGVASKKAIDDNIEASYNGKIRIKNARLVENSSGEKVVVSNSGLLEILNDSGNVLFSTTLLYSAKLFVNDGDKVKIGDKIAEWDPYFLYIVSEYDGVSQYSDLVINSSYIEKKDDFLGHTSKIVTNFSSNKKSLTPCILISTEDGKAIKNQYGSEISYFLPSGAEILVNDGDKINTGDYLAKIQRDIYSSAGDITGGLPRVEEIFECRTPDNVAVIAGKDGYIEFNKDTKNYIKAVLHPTDNSEPITYLLKKNKFIYVHNGEEVHAGDVIVDGYSDPHDILKYKGISALTLYVVNEIQSVYKLQGIDIDTKHIEIIVKYMLNKGYIDDCGDTTLKNTWSYDISTIREENEKALKQGLKPATYHIELNGISKSAMQTDSFIAAASFKETLKVLTNAAIKGQRDELRGMKESMIIGRLIPAGTGFITRQLKHEAMKKIGVDNASVDVNVNEEETYE